MRELGIALVPVSIPLGMIVKILIGNMIFGNLAMALGLIMMFPVNRIVDGFRFGKIAGIIFFLLMSFVYYFCSEFDDPMYLVYLGVSLVYALELSLMRFEEDVRMVKVVSYMWVLSLVCVIGGLVGFATGQIDFLTGAFSFDDGGETIYDGLTMGHVTITQMICSFFFLSASDLKPSLRPLLIAVAVLDLFTVFFSFKRTPMLVAFIIFIYYMRRLGYLSLSPKKILVLIVLLCAIVVYVMSTPELAEGISLLAENTFTGVIDLVTGNHTGHGLTNSTDMRIENRDLAFALISRFDMLQYMIGAGFMKFWFDMPLIQAYLDMGVLGFLLYGYYAVFIPLNVLFTSKRADNVLCFATMLCLYGAVCCLTSGHPYAHNQWMPVILLCFVLKGKQSIEEKKQ